MSQPTKRVTFAPETTNDDDDDYDDYDDHDDYSIDLMTQRQFDDVEDALRSAAESDNGDEDISVDGKKRAREEEDDHGNPQHLAKRPRTSNKEKTSSPVDDGNIDDGETIHLFPLINLRTDKRSEVQESIHQTVDHLVMVGNFHRRKAFTKKKTEEWENAKDNDKKKTTSDSTTNEAMGSMHVEDAIIYGVQGSTDASLIYGPQAYSRLARQDEKWDEFYGDEMDLLQFYNNDNDDYQPLVIGQETSDPAEMAAAATNDSSTEASTMTSKQKRDYHDSVAYRKIVLRCWERAVHACSKTMTLQTQYDPTKMKKIAVSKNQSRVRATAFVDLKDATGGFDTEDLSKEPAAVGDTSMGDMDYEPPAVDDFDEKPAAVQLDEPEVDGSDVVHYDDDTKFSREKAERKCEELQISLVAPTVEPANETLTPSDNTSAEVVQLPQLGTLTQSCPNCGIAVFDSFGQLCDHFYGTDSLPMAERVGSGNAAGEESFQGVGSSSSPQRYHSQRGCCWPLIERKQLECIAQTLETEARIQTLSLMQHLVKFTKLRNADEREQNSTSLNGIERKKADGTTDQSADMEVSPSLQWKDVLVALTDAMRDSRSFGGASVSAATLFTRGEQKEISIPSQLLETLALQEVQPPMILNKFLLQVVSDRVLERYGGAP